MILTLTFVQIYCGSKVFINLKYLFFLCTFSVVIFCCYILIRQRKETDGLRLLSAVPKIQWAATQLTHLRFKNVSKTSQKTLDNVFMYRVYNVQMENFFYVIKHFQKRCRNVIKRFNNVSENVYITFKGHFLKCFKDILYSL